METLADKPKSSETELSLAAQATEAFKRGNYDKCHELLEQQASSCSNSDILRQNLAVVSFYKSECKDHDRLLTTLMELDKVEVEPSKSSLLLKYNMAVIYFHRHMYQTAIEALMPVISKLEVLDERNATKAGLLMLRLLLATNQLRKAIGFLDFLQVKLGIDASQLAGEESVISKDTVSQINDHNTTLKLLPLLTYILNRKSVTVPEDCSVESSALRAHQYYIMKDFQVASKELRHIDVSSLSSGIQRDELSTCIANNMGVIHLRVRHYAIASQFFQNAICFDKKVTRNLREAPLHHKSAAHSPDVLYNMGIAMLHLKRPKDAFQCFLVPLKKYHNNPRLWFRMAEACIMDHEMKLSEVEARPLLASASTPGRHLMHLVKPTPTITYSSNSRSAAVPEPNLDFAALSLRNALMLAQFCLEKFVQIDEDELINGSNWKDAKDNHFCNPSSPISKQSLDNLLAAIYASYSFVSLRLGDFYVALEMAQYLLDMDNLSDAHKMLGHMYAGHALIMMDKLVEAKIHLEPTFVSSLNAFDFETKNWEVKSLEAAQNVARYNYATTLVLQGDFDAANNVLNTCTHPLVEGRVKKLKLYMELKRSVP